MTSPPYIRLDLSCNSLWSRNKWGRWVCDGSGFWKIWWPWPVVIPSRFERWM